MIGNALINDPRCKHRCAAVRGVSFAHWGYGSLTALGAPKHPTERPRGVGKRNRLAVHALAILRYLSRINEWLRLRTISRAINRPDSSTTRALNALIGAGLARRSRADKHWHYTVTDDGRRYSALPIEQLIGVLNYGNR